MAHGMPHDMSATQSGLKRLTPGLRQKIYHLAGIPRDQMIDLNMSPPNLPNASPWQHLVTTKRLMLTCRLISDEVSLLVYRDNIFLVLFHDDVADLNCLYKLRSSSIRAMTRLMVSRHRSCGEKDPKGGHSRCNDCFLYEWSNYPFNVLPMSRSWPIVGEWTHIWRNRILPNLVVGRLSLDFRCDMADHGAALEMARSFLDTSIDCSSVLSNVNMRFGANPDLGVTKLAEMVVDYLGPPRSEQTGPFRFLDLPAEIRADILDYTDLVCPTTQVNWTPERGFSVPRVRCFCLEERKSVSGPNGHASIPSPPNHGHGMLDTRDSKHHHLDLPYDIEGEEYGCQFLGCDRRSFPTRGFCPLRHAAASTTSRCSCWVPPRSLFLVCKVFRLQAMQTFFSSNRFAVLNDPGIWPVRLPCSVFIQSVVPEHAVRWLRFLEIVFPVVECRDSMTYASPGSNVWLDWIQAIELLQNHANLEALTIRAYFPAYEVGEDRRIPPFLRQLTTSDEHELRDACKDILKPMSQLAPRLGRFLVELDHLGIHSSRHRDWSNSQTLPWERYDGNEVTRRAKQEQYDPVSRSIERMVMGDHYDSNSMGRLQVPMLQWLTSAIFEAPPGEI